MTGQETRIVPGAHMLPGEYLEHCVAPFTCNVKRPPTSPERVKQAMMGKGWMTVMQIVADTGLTSSSVRDIISDSLQHDGTFEKKDGPPSSRGPRSKLWRWKSRESAQ